jgi:hypothetical protein|tara:strand:+ start:927 stop:1118 length:192 start_codon:yes stop_codon:yes gene_type:complete
MVGEVRYLFQKCVGVFSIMVELKNSDLYSLVAAFLGNWISIDCSYLNFFAAVPVLMKLLQLAD